jgi:hypothetical protein
MDAWFTRFAKREGISDDALKAIVHEMERGLCEDDLGGGVYKKRVARAGAGKSGGYRVILFFGGWFMKLKEKPISCARTDAVEAYQDTVNALHFMKLMETSEKAVRNGKVYDNNEVFSTLRKKSLQGNEILHKMGRARSCIGK